MRNIQDLPKIIHYCWFGKKEIPAKEKYCIKSWKKYFPDYQIMFWDENNFDINEIEFVKQAYEAKHFAFVSDYVRTKVLFDYGGIYLDTDVEILSDFNEILKKGLNFVGFETRAHIGTAVMGFFPKNSLLQEFIKYYQENSFINRKGEINTIANVVVLTDLMVKRGLNLGGTAQVINDIEVFPREYFYPKKISDNEFRITQETIAIHKCSNSWMTDRERIRGNNKLWINFMRPMLRTIRTLGLKILNEEKIKKIEISVRNLLK